MLKPGKSELRNVYVDTLISLAEKDPDIVVLEADLAGSIGTKRFHEKFPNQFVNCGIMEANMVGVAAGLSLTGKKPYLHTFGSFASRRAFDQVFLSLAYSGLSAVILGSDSGIASEYNGGTHMPFEDIGLMRMIPGCIVVEASDEIMLKKLLLMSYHMGGLWYIRTCRKLRPRIYENTKDFVLGQGNVLVDGTDVVIFTYGISTADSLIAAEELSRRGISTAVVDMFSIQPLDREIIMKYLDQVKAVVTVENHQIVNGIGTAVAEVIAESGKAIKFSRMGVIERFGQTGSMEYLKREYEIDPKSIENKVVELFQ